MKFFPSFLIVGLCQLFISIKCSQPSGSRTTEDKNDTEAFSNMMQHLKKFEVLKGYRIPESMISNEFVEEMSVAHRNLAHDMLVVPPRMRLDNPGSIILDHLLPIRCHYFRMRKNSINPASYSNSDKYEFLEKITDLGVFFDFEGRNMNTIDSDLQNPKLSKKQKALLERAKAGLTACSVINNYFCRDAIRLVADVMSEDQISWMLKYASAVILGQPEILDILKDFSFFNAEYVCDAMTHIQYDWFKNSKALKTFKPSVLLSIIREKSYDLSLTELEALNAARPLKELFALPEFAADPYLWQVVYNTPFFHCSPISVDALISEIQKCATRHFPPELKQAVFAFYQLNDFAIGDALSKISQAPTAVFPEGPSAEFNESARRAMANANLDILEKLIDDRARFISAFEESLHSFPKVDEESVNFLRVFKIPASLAVRRGIANSDLYNFHDSVEEPLLIEDLIDSLRELKEFDLLACKNDLGKCKYWEGNALIFSFMRAKKRLGAFQSSAGIGENEIGTTTTTATTKNDESSNDVKIPFLPFDFDPKMSALDWLKMLFDMIKVGSVFEIDVETSSGSSLNFVPIVTAKGAKFFFLNVAMDLAFGRLHYIHEFGLEAYEMSLEYLFKSLLGRCCLDLFNEYEIGMLRSMLPEASKELVESIENLLKPETVYKTAREHFMNQYQFHESQHEHSENITKDIASRALDMQLSETVLQVNLQSFLKPEFYDFIREDEAALKILGENGHLLRGNQVEDLFKSESGRALLLASRALLYNLPTYEYMKVTDVKPLKFRAQFATSLRTVPKYVKLISFKYDNWEFEDPLSVALRTGITFVEWVGESEMLDQSWRFAPFQVVFHFLILAEAGAPLPLPFLNSFYGVTKCLTSDKSIAGDHLAGYRAILLWTITRELNFLEAFGMLYAHPEGHHSSIVNAATAISHGENDERFRLLTDWIDVHEVNTTIRERLSERFSYHLVEVLTGPLSPVRAGALLSAHDVMNKTLRNFRFTSAIESFSSWRHKMAELVNEMKRNEPAKFSKAVLNTAEMPKMKTEFVYKSQNVSLQTILDAPMERSNISGVCELIEVETFDRRETLKKLLIEIDGALGVDQEITKRWLERIKLLGMISGNGLTPSPYYSAHPVNPDLLNLFDRITYQRCATSIGLIGPEENPEELKKMAEFAIYVDKQPRANSADSTKKGETPDKKTKKNGRK